MKSLTEFIQESQINESLLLTGALSLIIGALISGTIIASVPGVAGKSLIDDFIYSIKNKQADKRAQEIIDRLKDDDDVVAFFNQPKREQQYGWRDLLASKLTDDEMKYIARITKTKFDM